MHTSKYKSMEHVAPGKGRVGSWKEIKTIVKIVNAFTQTTETSYCHHEQCLDS